MPLKSARPPKKGSVKALKAKEEAAAAAAASAGAGDDDDDVTTAIRGATTLDQLDAALNAGKAEVDTGRTATGYLVSEKRARDIKIQQFSLALHSSVLVEDTTIELNYGQRYGLIGRNGCGKSTLLSCLAAREVPIPEHIDVYLLSEEAQPSELSALEYVIDSARREVDRLEELSERILTEDGPDSELLMDVYDRQADLDPSTFETRASTILIGLGFDSRTVHKKTKDMSGGWRMRVALARALFIAPTMLLLDEPTNHLDLEACVWLEEYLSTYPRILVVISHSQDFLNGVCTNMMVMQQRKLKYWGGNYDTYQNTRREQDANQLKLYRKQQDEIAHTKEFIASCGTFANLVRQAKSRQKMLDKMVEDGLIEPPFEEPLFRFRFPDAGKMPPPLISFSRVSFSYSGEVADYLFSDVSFGIDCDSRIALVGPNGAGKSTLLKLMVGENAPCEGTVSIRSGVAIGRYHQHSCEVLDLDASPVDYLDRKFKPRYPEKGLEEWRSVVGAWGIPSQYHMQPIRLLSEGLRLRLVFCEISLQRPHVLLMDEPTNAADMEMIDSMAEAINKFEGGVVVISHDFRLLNQIADEIWVVDHGIHRWDGDIRSYKNGLKRSMAAKATLRAV